MTKGPQEGNPDLVHAQEQGVATGGRQSVPDASALSPGNPEAPGARPKLEPGGPVVEGHAEAPAKKK